MLRKQAKLKRLTPSHGDGLECRKTRGNHKLVVPGEMPSLPDNVLSPELISDTRIMGLELDQPFVPTLFDLALSPRH
jgi:hypothetical protein